jgi:hypothetical protein
MEKTMFVKNPATLLVIFLGMVISTGKSEANQDHKKLNILFYGAFSSAQEMGNYDEYLAGENDFPVTPSHGEVGLGMGVIWNLSRRAAVKFSGDYLLGAEVKKEDPSDMETCTYRTYDNINLIGSGIIRFGEVTQFFISPGAGINMLVPYGDTQKTGSLGSIIVIEAPAKKIHPLMAFGAGVIHNMKKNFFVMEILFTRIFQYQKNSIMFRLGFGF